MTCVVGIADKGKVWMGADSAVSYGWARREARTEKMFVKEEFLIGLTGSVRLGNLLQFVVDYTELSFLSKPYNDNLEFMVKEFMPKLRAILKDNGEASIKDNIETGGHFIVGFEGELYTVSSDYSVLLLKPSYDAIGSGQDFALGSLHTTYPTGVSGSTIHPKDAIRQALESSSFFSAYVQEPFTFLSIGDEDEDN